MKQELIRLTNGWVYWSKEKQKNYDFGWKSQFAINSITDDITFDQPQILSRLFYFNKTSQFIGISTFLFKGINPNLQSSFSKSKTLWRKIKLDRKEKPNEIALIIFGLVPKTIEKNFVKNLKNILEPTNTFYDQLDYTKDSFFHFYKNNGDLQNGIFNAASNKSCESNPYRYSKTTQQCFFTQFSYKFFQKNISNSYLRILSQFLNNQKGDSLDFGVIKKYSLIYGASKNQKFEKNLTHSNLSESISINLSCHCPNLNFYGLKSKTFASSSGILFHSFGLKDLQISSLSKSNDLVQFEFFTKTQTVAEKNQLSQIEGEIVYVTNKLNEKDFPNHSGRHQADLLFDSKLGNQQPIAAQNQRFLLLNGEHVKQFSFTLEEKEKPLLELGKILRVGDLLKQDADNSSSNSEPLATFDQTEDQVFGSPVTGQIIQIKKSTNFTGSKRKYNVIIRTASSVLFSSQGVFHVDQNDLVTKGTPLITLFYQRLKTGDIVQGIPKIEEFFEARQTKQGEYLVNNLHEQLQRFFFKYQKVYSLDIAVKKSFQELQEFIVDGVQGVYQSQGVTISDKHLEIIVRQMTSIVRIVNGGSLGLLPGELVNVDSIELFNRGVDGQIAEYEPIVLGITKASLETKSFISAASFQETTRILSRAAVSKKTDFLRGLKESVIVGHLIPAGTGFFKYPLPLTN